MLTDEQIQELRTQLEQRSRALREEIREELIKSDKQHFIDLAGRVRDLEEAAVADMLVDLNLSLLDLQVQELRDIDAAFVRMQTGDYGTCIDCGGDVGYPRLRAYPTAKRCLDCQTVYERTHQATPPSTL